MSTFDISPFNNGGSYLVDDDTYRRFIKKKDFLGRPNDACGELSVAPSDEIDKNTSKKWFQNNSKFRELSKVKIPGYFPS